MNTPERLLQILLLVALASPALLVAMLVVLSIPKRPLSERAVARMTSSAVATLVVSLTLALVVYVTAGLEPQTWTAREWLTTTSGALQLDVLVDGWSLSFAAVSAVICGTVSIFSFRYLHLEQGFVRYFVLYACFVLGVQLVALAGSVEVLFAGWELLGLSSSLLVAFFHERRSPVVNGMRVFAIYRVSDAAMLVAAVLVHHLVGSGSLATLFRAGTVESLDGTSRAQLVTISAFLLLAVASKSALVPFSGWLPRAMEGPTPSSAVYYGALSVHAGCYLLWRASPIIQSSLVSQALVIAVGATTAVYAALASRVQTNVKAALSYATLTQVGVIVVEIALGFRTLAFIHLLGNACVRLVQFLMAPNVLLDLHGLEARTKTPTRWPRLYAFALQDGGLDVFLDQLVERVFRPIARVGQRLDEKLSGERPIEPRAEKETSE
ncbi:MAG: oxidoreductase [Deltaproteobacteria bacterium]|nr:oxidoreductase [Deltaproteobacteria bacterium]